MSLTVKSRTAMQERKSMVIAADNVKGPGQGNWTYEAYAAIPYDGKHYEIVNGVLFMTPAPNPWHQEIVGELFAYLRDHIKLAGRGKVYFAPFDVELLSKHVVQPDLLVILNANLGKISEKRVIGAPDLVVEVASAATTEYDHHKKLEAYALAGVPEYWLVDPIERIIEVLVLETGTYYSRGNFQGDAILPSKILPEFLIPVERFFA